jgi:hypothetical protein
MLNFLNEDVRKEFHLLPLERQREFMKMSEGLRHYEQSLTILHVDHFGQGSSEVLIRLEAQYNVRPLGA